MRETVQLSAIVGDIYDAAVQPENWPAALESVCRYVGGSAAMLIWHDAIFRESGRHYSWGDDPVYTTLYFQIYIRLNPTAELQNTMPVGTAVAISDLMPPEQMQDTRFFNEWMQPQGYVDNVFANLERSSTAIAVFAVARHVRDGLIDADALCRMQLLVPHVQRAVMIGKLLEAGRAERIAVREFVDGIAACIFFVDRNGTIVHFNTAAGHLIDGGAVVTRRGDGHVAFDRDTARAIREILESPSGDVSGQGRQRSLPVSGRNGKDYLMGVISLGEAGRADLPDAPEAVAAIFVRPAEIDTPAGVALMARRFRLTPRETDILRGLVDVGGVPQVAAHEGIAVRTVKAHLQSMFTKTGTARQAELVKLLAGFAAAF